VLVLHVARHVMLFDGVVFVGVRLVCVGGFENILKLVQIILLVLRCDRAMLAIFGNNINVS
jgi:hypothetical protein